MPHLTHLLRNFIYLKLICAYKETFFRALVGGKSIGENYAFVGVYHIFDDHLGSAGSISCVFIL